MVRGSHKQDTAVLCGAFIRNMQKKSQKDQFWIFHFLISFKYRRTKKQKPDELKNLELQLKNGNNFVPNYEKFSWNSIHKCCYMSRYWKKDLFRERFCCISQITKKEKLQVSCPNKSQKYQKQFLPNLEAGDRHAMEGDKISFELTEKPVALSWGFRAIHSPLLARCAPNGMQIEQCNKPQIRKSPPFKRC
jgi:hypothetical protein